MDWSVQIDTNADQSNASCLVWLDRPLSCCRKRLPDRWFGQAMIVVVDRRRNVVGMLPYFYIRFLVRRVSQLTAQEKNAQNKTKQFEQSKNVCIKSNTNSTNIRKLHNKPRISYFTFCVWIFQLIIIINSSLLLVEVKFWEFFYFLFYLLYFNHFYCSMQQ